ncbi:uncharacterized protein UV8b_07289 [Ustilaginoidea virens]|uniref:Letm1 RBD domain-containing protein n=1 Tax=Ustilaginoidea virens TaxID=1159556 RepID=A0A8E5HXC2_USTVR|nr:uncharacterized protein UV8b_07289 [Ustilaginoidea virens]QUC23048.1 hypothetical protein UV8b_07289 [Ustilaginoidea virens]
MKAPVPWRQRAASHSISSISISSISISSISISSISRSTFLTRASFAAPAASAARPQRRRAHDAPPSRRGQRFPTPKSPLLNPPASTRPPPLDVPARGDAPSTFRYLLQLGKGYLRFYKDGLRAVLANRRLLRDKLARTPSEERPSVFWRRPPPRVPRTFSRADWVLLWRVRHDLLRLPLFGLMLVVIGEFTALAVVYVDGVVPHTCRVPRQLRRGLERAEQRRRAAFDDLEARHPHGVLSPRVGPAVARRHVLRSLHLSGRLWDRLGAAAPHALLWRLKGRPRMAFLDGDDRGLIEDGGPTGLEPEELRIACAERGIDVLGRREAELRTWLGDWLRLTAAEDAAERRRRVAVLLMTRREHWPLQRDFAVPDWEL